MISTETLDEFKCALSEEKHFLINPITLSKCGHSVCKNCLPNGVDAYKCKICGEITTDVDLSKIDVSKEIKQTMKSFLGNIFESIESQTVSKLNELKNNLKNHEEFLDIKVKYLEEEIDIRVESIIIEVEEAAIRLKDQLKKMKKDTLKLDGVDDESKLKLFDLDLQELQNSIKTKIDLNEEFLDKVQNNLKSLNQIVQLNSSNKIPEIRFSEEKIHKNLIGKLYFEPISFEDLLEIGEKRIYDLDVSPNAILIIDDQIIVASIGYECLQIYDKQFNFVKIIDKINGETFSPNALASNLEDKIIFICDYVNSRILMVDFDFSFIKSAGSCASESNEFDYYPSDICYKNECLYICDASNKRVKIFSKDLVFVKSIELSFEPNKIRASSSIICIECLYKGTYFYNLNDFSLIRSYPHEGFRISQINSCFYGFNNRAKIVYCYDDNGIFKEEINLTDINFYFTDCYLTDSFYKMDDSIFLMSYSEKMITKISMNRKRFL